MEAKLHQQDMGISIYVSSGRFDIQFNVKRLSEIVTKPREVYNIRLAWLARFSWARRSSRSESIIRSTATSCESPQTPTGLAVKNGPPPMEDLSSTEGHLVGSWVAELFGIVDGSAQGIFTKHTHEEMGRTINVDVETDSTAAIGMFSRTGVGKTRHIQIRWLWIQDAIRDKVVRMKKVKGTENEAHTGTKDRPTHQRLLQKLPQ